MTGGVLAAPIFTEFMKTALQDAPPKEFQVPPGIELIPIDRRTGLRAQAGGDGVILEAFKPGKSPPAAVAYVGTRPSTRRHRMPARSPDAPPFTSSVQRLSTGEAYQELPNGVIIKVR